MENCVEESVLSRTKEKKLKKKHPFRDTVLIRVDRRLRDEIKGISERSKEPISRLADWALEDYLKSVKTKD